MNLCACEDWARRHGSKFNPGKYELLHLTRTPKKFNIKANIKIEIKEIYPYSRGQSKFSFKIENTAPNNRNIRIIYIKRLIIDYRFYIGLRNIREPTNIYLNNTAGDTIRGERIVYAEEY
jgi:hypothetical protein